MNSVPEIKNKIIVYGVLNWGLGHASRSASIIKQLLKNGNKIHIVSWGKALSYLKIEFPECDTYDLNNSSIHYPNHKLLWWSLMLQLNKFKKSIRHEQQFISDFIKKNKVDVIISDNCYGFYHSTVKSIIVSHQLHIIAPIFTNFINKKIKGFINCFHEIWIPDFNTSKNLSGKLSHPALNEKCVFIGPQSNLVLNIETDLVNHKFEYCAIISGPEKFRTKFETLVIDFLNQQNKPAVVIRGVYDNLALKIDAKSNINLVQHAQGLILNQYISQSKIIICACGYSSIMDMYVVQKKCIMFPTPGQSEQEYLWQKHFSGKKYALNTIEPRQIELNDN